MWAAARLSIDSPDSPSTLASTSRVCSPRRGGARSYAGGVADSLAGLASMDTWPARGCATSTRMPRAFMCAGAPTAGVSPWSVADKSTADLMTDFYQRLLSASAGTTSSGALRSAQLAMISGKKYSAPFYWAPFVLVGDWN